MHTFEADEIDTLYGANWAVVGFTVRTPNGQITVDLTEKEKAQFAAWDGEDDPGINSIFEAVQAKAVQPITGSDTK